jgi:16S rRNA (cytosine1402-N4)-methyltransferase
MASFYESHESGEGCAAQLHSMTDPSPHDSTAPGGAADAARSGHAPVLAEAVVAYLDPRPGRVVLDCTVGRGGHAAMVLPHLRPGGRLVGLDLDAENLSFSRGRLEGAGAGVDDVRVDLVHANFAGARAVLDGLGIDGVDGLVADFGFASTQMDDPRRGFSFDADGPLDMRMDRTATLTAAELVNELPERELADLIYRYGEERRSRAIAAKIAAARRVRPMNSTSALSQLVCAAYGGSGRRQRIHPATRTFMALRIAVNGELASIERLLADLPRLLRPGARAVLISFHSLEDRLVKHAFRDWRQADLARVLAKKPVRADEREQRSNPRSRSAKLRALEWI